MLPQLKKPQFISPYDPSVTRPVTLVELRMRRFSGSICAKPRWWEKVNDAAVVAKWREEIVEQDSSLVEKLWGGEERYHDNHKMWPRDPITDAQVEYIIRELQYEASQRDPETGIFAELGQAITLLEDVPDEKKDWHRGTNQQVLDLVHPSLYCLRIGQSIVRKKGTNFNEVITEEAYKDARPDVRAFLPREGRWPFDRHAYILSNKFQWLPTDFEVSETGDVTPLSYINNLHPTRHAAQYSPITSILSRFLPLFERVLSDVLSPDLPLTVTVDPMEWHDRTTHPEPDWFDQEAYSQWEREYGWPIIHDPAPFHPPDLTERTQYSLRGRTLQVIVKLANIHLTPDNPRYPGGSWHVEGMANENIVATGLYYYACENITESRLAFRISHMRAGDALEYEQNDFRGWDVVLGHVVATEDKCSVFPNIYQRRVEPFELADPTRPGHRKILCFFLVNPEVEILSTTHVPPQQEDWVMEEAENVPVMQDLPVELFQLIADDVRQGLVSREEAERHREELMKERSSFVVEFIKSVYEVEFFMCEH